MEYHDQNLPENHDSMNLNINHEIKDNPDDYVNKSIDLNKSFTGKQKMFLVVGLLLLLGICIILFVHYRKVNQERLLMIEKASYAVPYPELVRQYSTKYDLDPYLVAAVINTESHGDVDAVSNRGAIGLMQVLPSTAEWIVEKLGGDTSSIDLTDPETNIHMGTWYLRFLLDRFSRDAAIVAYNAGQGNVSKWLDDEQYSTDGETLIDIPFQESDEYIVKVNKAYEKTKEFYPDIFSDVPVQTPLQT